MSALKRQASTGAMWSAFQNGTAKLINFVVFVVLARLLVPEDFGLVAMVGVALAFVHLAVEQGFEEAIVQRDRLEQEHLDSTFWLCGALGFALSICLLLSASALSGMLAEPRLEALLVASAPAILLSALSKVPLGIMRREFNFKALALRQIAAAALGGVIGVAMAVSGAGAWSLIGRLLGESAAGFAMLWLYSGWRPRLKFSLRHTKEILDYGSSVVASSFLGFLSQRADSLVIGYWLGPVALGLYSMGQRLFQLLMDLLQGTINQVALSVFARIQNEPQRIKQVFLTSVRVTAIASFPIFAILAVASKEIITFVFGARWEGAAPVVAVFAVGGLLFSVAYYSATVMKAMGRPGWVFGLTALNGVTSVVGYLIGVAFGIGGVAAAFVLRGYLLYPLNLILLKRLIGLRFGEYLKCLWPPAMSAVFAAGAGWLMMQELHRAPLWIQLGTMGVLSGTTYVGMMWMFWPASTQKVLDILRTAVRAQR